MQPAQPSPQEAQQKLEQVAALLRSADHLEPQAQREIADLLEELAKVLGRSTPATPEAAHLAETTANVARAVHEQHQGGLLDSATRRLEEAALRAQAQAPLAVGIVRRLLAALADLGI